MGKEERVNHPDHYNQGNIECIDAMLSAFGREAVANFCVVNAFKYVWRTIDKNGVEDIDKAIWYLNKYKELLNNGAESSSNNNQSEESMHWVDDEDAPKPSLNEAKLEEVIDYSLSFNCGFSGTSKLVRMPSKGVIKIARRKGDMTQINSVCISDDMREKFFEDVYSLRNSAYAINKNQVYYDFWNDFMNEEYARQLKNSKQFN